MYDIIAYTIKRQVSPMLPKFTVPVFHDAIHYILSGHGYFNGIRLGRGQGFAIHDGEAHEYYNDANDPWTYVWFRIGGKDAEKALEECNLNGPRCFFDVENINLIEHIYNLYDAMSESEKKSRIAQSAFANMFLSCRTINSDIGHSDIKSLTQYNHFTMMLKYINRHYTNNLTVKAIAAHFSLSDAYIRELFDKYLGYSPKNYIIRRKVSQASRLLINSNDPLSTVSADCGFGDVYQFSKTFKKITGYTPSAYRSQSKNKRKANADKQPYNPY